LIFNLVFIQRAVGRASKSIAERLKKKECLLDINPSAVKTQLSKNLEVVYIHSRCKQAL
jgi:hypothetical protein